jgi:hypothetical protein
VDLCLHGRGRALAVVAAALPLAVHAPLQTNEAELCLARDAHHVLAGGRVLDEDAALYARSHARAVRHLQDMREHY